LLSDFAYDVIYNLLGYRKKVVLQNLSIAFPNKTDKERRVISRKFYANFCDSFVETLKFISAPPSFFKKHFIADLSVIEDLYKQGDSVQIHMGHNFNWELSNLAFPFYLPYKTLVLYSPLKSKWVNRLLLKIRTRMGSYLIAATAMRKEILPHRNTQYVMALIADQSPSIPEQTYWVPFFGRPTGFFKGPEKSARLNNFPVVFCHFTKVKRGYYRCHTELVTMAPRTWPEGELTKVYAQRIEQWMKENPEIWLWSHRRWKREWKPEYGPVIE
jgi:KDO2-lipid IV(A) lauroyltransferase